MSCGEGTILKDGKCVVEETPPPDAGPDLECGPGTVPSADGSQCVPDLDCPDGTAPTNDGTGCAPICEDPFVLDGEDCVCPPGLVPTPGGGDCQIDPALCAEGTVFDESTGQCRPIVAPPPADDDTIPDEAPVVFDLPGVNDKPTEIGGVVGPVDRAEGADLDVFEFDAEAGDRMLVQLVSFGAQAASFILVGVDDNTGDYFRVGFPLANRRSVRTVVIPVSGRYAFIVSDRANVLDMLGVPGIPVGGEDHTYSLVIDTLPAETPTTIAADGTSHTGAHDNIDAFRVDPSSTPAGAILNARLAANDADPDFDTVQVLWYVDNAGNYVEIEPGATPAIDTLLPQLGGGTLVYVDYLYRLGAAPTWNYDLSVIAPTIHDGPVSGGDPVDSNTDGADLTFYEVELQAEHVYRMRLRLPANTTIPNTQLALVDTNLNIVTTSDEVEVGGVTYQELRYYAGPDVSGTHYLTVLGGDEQNPLEESNFNLRLTLDEAPVVRGGTLSLDGTTEDTKTLDDPTATDADTWVGPWVLTTVNDIADLTVATNNYVTYSAFDARTFGALSGTSSGVGGVPEGVHTGTCEFDATPHVTSSVSFEASVSADDLGNEFPVSGPGCSVGSGGDLFMLIEPQPAGTVVTLTAGGEDADVGVGFQTTCSSTCISRDDNGGDGVYEEATYTFTGDETGPIMAVVDTWSWSIGTMEISLQIGDGPALSEETVRTYRVAAGTQLLVQALGGNNDGQFDLTSSIAPTPFQWESEPNDGIDSADDLIGLVATPAFPVGDGTCDFGAAPMIESSGVYASTLPDPVGNDFHPEDSWDSAAKSGTDAYWKIPAQPEGTQVTIEVLPIGPNADADTYLALLNAAECDPSNADRVAYDDQGGAGNLSKLTYTWGAEETDLLLLLDSFSSAALVPGDVVLSVSFSTEPLPAPEWNGTVQANDADWWTIEVPQTGMLTLNVGEGPMEPTGDVAVTLYDSTGTNEVTSREFLIGSGWDEPGEIITYVEPGTYYAAVTFAPERTVQTIFGPIVVGGVSGSYSLSWELDPYVEAPTTCQAPVAITTSGTYSGDTSTGVGNWQPTDASCFGYGPENYFGQDDIYAVTLPAGATLRATLDSSFDAALALVSDCSSACLMGSDNTVSGDETFTYANTTADTVELLLVVEGWFGEAGEYDLIVEMFGDACVGGQERCTGDGHIEICNADGTAFEIIDCPGGCAYDEFEQVASCNAYCGEDTTNPNLIQCTGNTLQVCSADKTRYLETACAVECTQVTDETTGTPTDAFCTFGLCAGDLGGTVCADGVEASCNDVASSSNRVSCAAGCDEDGQFCAPPAIHVLTNVADTGACDVATTPSDPITESGELVLVLDGTEANDFDDDTLACGSSSSSGSDVILGLGPKPAGTTVRVRVEGASVDPTLGFQLACDAAACIGDVDDGWSAGDPEESTYTYDGTETTVLVVVDSWTGTWSGELAVEVEFSDDPLVPTAPAICTPDVATCDSATNVLSTCNADGTSEEQVYCDYGCNAEGNGCTPLTVALGDSCASVGSLSHTPVAGTHVFPIDLSSFAPDLTGSCSSSPGNDGVFSFVAPFSGDATITTSGEDTTLYVREATCTGVEVDCSGDDGFSPPSGWGSTVEFEMVGGVEYFVIVDLWDDEDLGSNITMTMTLE